MPKIHSANEDFPAVDLGPGGSLQTGYVHGADTRKNYVPLAFQVTSPYPPFQILLPHSLVSHVNPRSLSESLSKKVEKIQTRGGFVEQHWGDELGEISVDTSTGAFININSGLSSVIRERTIAWDRYRDLYDLYRNNGGLYDPMGAIVLQGQIMLMYDRGTYLGYFKSFEVEETDTSPFAFSVSWSFKVEKTLYQVPANVGFYATARSQGALNNRGGAAFQSQNSKPLPTSTALYGSGEGRTAKDQEADAKLAADAAAQAVELARLKEIAATAESNGFAGSSLDIAEGL